MAEEGHTANITLAHTPSVRLTEVSAPPSFLQPQLTLAKMCSMSTTRRWFLACLVAQPIMIGKFSPVYAQADSGVRIRVTTDIPRQKPWVGTLISAGSDSVRIRPKEGGVVSVPSASIVRVEQSRGRRSNSGKGAVTGAIIGGGIGLILGIAASSEEADYVEIGPGGVVAATALFAAGGTGLGALIGSGSHRERWEPITLPRPDHSVGDSTGPSVQLVIRF
jgi:hypothetical protein